jgi:hypothetical protein
MTGVGWAQLAAFGVVLTALTPPLGGYMARVFGGELALLARLLGPVERAVYRLARVDPRQDQDWKRYSMLVFSAACFITLYVTLRTQGVHPLNPHGFGPGPWDVSFNTAVSFVSKEQRFGIAGTALYAVATTSGASGAVNGAMEPLSGLGAAVPLAQTMTGEVIFGGIGSGPASMLLMVLLAAFLGGLMVGRTPEYLGKKLDLREVKLVVLGAIAVPVLVLALAALAVSTAYVRRTPPTSSAASRCSWAALAHPQLPSAAQDDAARELQLLTSHREALVRQRSEAQDRLRWLLHNIAPDLQISAGALDRKVWLDRAARRLTRGEQTVGVRIARDLVRRCRSLTRDANELEREIALLVAGYAPQLLELKGCGALIAGKIIGETAGAGRFRNDAQFARLAGVAPIDASSGQQRRHPTQPPRQPPAQQRAAQDRDRPRPLRPAGPCLLAARAGCREEPP